MVTPATVHVDSTDYEYPESLFHTRSLTSAPLLMASDNDVDTFTADSFREFIKEMWLFSLLCAQIRMLKVTLKCLA